MKTIFFIFLVIGYQILGLAAVKNDTTYSVKEFKLSKNDCRQNTIGLQTVEYIVTTKTFKDTIGLKMNQTQPNENFFLKKAQQTTNEKTTCMTVYHNKQRDTIVYRNTCSVDSFGGEFIYRVKSKKYVNAIDENHPNQMATQDIKDSAQLKADLYGICYPYFYNDQMEKVVAKQCKGDSLGRPYKYVVGYKKYSDMISILNSNLKAMKDLEDSAQFYANTYGVCRPLITYYVRETVRVNKNVCPKTNDRNPTITNSRCGKFLEYTCPSYNTNEDEERCTTEPENTETIILQQPSIKE